MALFSCLISSYSLAPLAYGSVSSSPPKLPPSQTKFQNRSQARSQNKFNNNQGSSGAGSGSLTIVDQSGQNKNECPLKHTDVVADISGYIARVTVEQEFTNPYSETIEAIYTFPLSHSSAVDGMTMQIGSRTIVGKIMKRDQAMQVYKEAKREGHSAARLDQERPNIFSQSVANIPPHSTIKIQIVYSDVLPYQSGGYSFHFPMVVGSRYSPGQAIGQQGNGVDLDTDKVPDASLISPPMVAERTRAGHDISLKVNLDAGVNFANLQSKLHQIKTTNRTENKATVTLVAEDSIPNRDFVLSWTVAGSELKTGYLTHKNGPTGYFTMMLVPPAKPRAEQINTKELIFIVDRSGSQSGLPLQKARETMLYILDHLNAQDTFQVISFSNGVEMLFAKPQPVTANTIDEAKKYVASLQADGGTEMQQAVEIASAHPAPDNRLRIFALMTDGYIGNDKEIIDLVKKTRATSRWFTFGTGNSVNRYLIDGVATAGGGEAEFVLLNSPSQKVAEEFYEKLASPVLTDISLKFAGLEVAEVNPKLINDVWAERPIYITGKYLKAGKGTAILQGVRGNTDERNEQKIALDFPAASASNTALPSLWARSQVDELIKKSGSDLAGQVSPAVRSEIENLGLQYHLMTKYTSYVAVDTSDKLIPTARTVSVKVESPDGVSQRERQVKFQPGNLAPLNLNLPEEIGRAEGPRDINLFQVEPTVVDERHYSSGRAERHQKTSPTLPNGAPVPDSESGPANVRIISKTDLTVVKATDTTTADLRPEDKIDVELRKTISAWTKIQDDSTKLHLKIKLAPRSDDAALSLLLKRLHITVLTTNIAGDQMIAVVPVRRINELAASKQVIRLSLAQ